MRTDQTIDRRTQHGKETAAHWGVVVRRWQRELEAQQAVRRAFDRLTQARMAA